METSLKTGFAQFFSCCPKKLSCPKLGRGDCSLNQTVKALQTKVSYVEIDVVAVKENQKSLEEDSSHVKENAKFIDEKITEVQENADKRNEQISVNAVSKSSIWKPTVAGKIWRDTGIVSNLSPTECSGWGHEKSSCKLFWRRPRYGGPRILCAKHGSPKSGKSFIVSFRFVEYQKPWIKTEVLFLFMFHIELLFIFSFITCHSRILQRVKFKNVCGFAVCSVLFFFHNLALKFQLFVYAFIFSLKKWDYLKNERVLLYSKTARLVGFSSPSLSFFLIKW